MSKLQTPRGTHDLIGDAAITHKTIIDLAFETALTFGYSPIDTPIFEFSSVFSRTLGEASDIVNKEMYTFEDRGGESLTLRPEGTAPIARAFISNGMQRQLPLKLFYAGPMFRYERPQKGRQRQFHQVGVEFLGADNPIADSEVLSLADQFLKKLQLKNLSLEINSIGDEESRDQYRKALVAYYETQWPLLSKDSLKRLKLNPLRILDSKDEGDIKINESAPVILDHLNEESKTRFEKVCNYLEQMDIKYHVNPHLVRGLDYYGHLVFEFKAEGLGAQNTVLAGGRYNKLIAQMGGPETPGIGWASGIERLALLTQKDLGSQALAHIVPLGEAAEEYCPALLHELRLKNVPVEMSYSGNMSKRMKKAANRGAKAVVIIGEEELNNKQATIKNLETGSQVNSSLENLSESLLKVLQES